ncbi:MAG: AraC family transcriptional regulator [Clostridia bacterium]|nr:AraC family transcriptional regulator [Clostridia bacterium]
MNSDLLNEKFNSILPVVEFINENYDKNHSIQDYADLCNYNKYYLIKLFSKYTGMSPVLYRTKIRIEKAKELMISTELNNTQVAELVGYSSPYYFGRMFKMHTGYSPEKYRIKYK